MKIPKRLSIDIETLSLKSDAAILQIGACIFDHENIHEMFSITIDPILTPGRRDLSTWEWWQKQSLDVRNDVFSGKTTPWDAAIEFQDWLERVGSLDEIWANPPGFDIVILRNWYQAIGSNAMDKALPFRQERDYRTVRALARAKGVITEGAHLEEGLSPHIALDDAIHQARVIQTWIREELIS